MKTVDFDWDGFEAEGKELERRMRAVVAELNRQKAAPRPWPSAGGHSLARERPPHDSAWDDRLDRFERMMAETLTTVTALQRDVSGLQRDVSGLQRDVATIREQMATRVELEALRDSINIVADGFAQTQTRLENVAGLLKRYLTT